MEEKVSIPHGRQKRARDKIAPRTPTSIDYIFLLVPTS
jgi:hypothetical protein